jgi:hypothetical protein
MGDRSDNEIRDVHDYAHCTDLKDSLTFMNDEMTAPTRIAARKRPILQSRRHTAHVLINRITSYKIKVDKFMRNIGSVNLLQK